MKLIENLMEKMMQLYEEFDYRGYDIRSVWYFYNCYSITIMILGVEDKKLRLKNHLWRRIMFCQYKGKPDLHALNKLKRLVLEDMALVNRALKEISKENENLGLNEGDSWGRNVIGVPYYDLDI